MSGMPSGLANAGFSLQHSAGSGGSAPRGNPADYASNIKCTSSGCPKTASSMHLDEKYGNFDSKCTSHTPQTFTVSLRKQ